MFLRWIILSSDFIMFCGSFSVGIVLEQLFLVCSRNFTACTVEEYYLTLACITCRLVRSTVVQFLVKVASLATVCNG